MGGLKDKLLSALLGAVITGIGAYLMLGRVTVTRAEVSDMIQVQSPYIQDRKTVDRLQISVDALTAQVVLLSTNVAALTTKVQILTQQEK